MTLRSKLLAITLIMAGVQVAGWIEAVPRRQITHPTSRWLSRPISVSHRGWCEARTVLKASAWI